jgi:uncharacterized protein
MHHTDDDRTLVESQLGRPPRGTWAVARRCHLGVPMVIENHPVLDDGSPFPTLFWLTCPILVKRASALEAAGYMTELTAELERGGELRARLTAALGRYRDRRNAHDVIAETGAPPGGGPDRIKCLHAHVAHEIADAPNPIGARALGRAGWPDCIVPCVRKDGS